MASFRTSKYKVRKDQEQLIIARGYDSERPIDSAL